MKRSLTIALIVLALLAGAVYLLREPIMGMMIKSFTEDMFVDQDEDEFTAGPPVGTELPAIRADYLGEEISSLSRFSGPNGLVVMLNRSLDWCIFCQKQAIELNDNLELFISHGIGVVMLIYDQPDARDLFVQEHNISYPILSDINTESVKALGVLNQDYEEGDGAYGIPYPGTIVSSVDGNIVGKLFIQEYQKRVNAQSISQQALSWLADDMLNRDTTASEDGVAVEPSDTTEPAE